MANGDIMASTLRTLLRILAGLLAAAFLALAALLFIGRSHVYKGPSAEPPQWDPRAEPSAT